MEELAAAHGSSEIRRTPLYSMHLQLGARMVPFAGYEMPVQYPAGIRAEHEHTRTQAGLFDISHMGQIRLEGESAAEWLESLVPGDIKGLLPGQQRYSVLTNSAGGVIDDLMITRMPDYYFLVVNASRKQHDFDYLKRHLPSDCKLTHLTSRGLLAIQGPAASAVLARLDSRLQDMPFLTAISSKLAGIECLVHRCGYTGEDGYEISTENSEIEALATLLLNSPEVKPIGLGARDSLRLEAGLSLYGHELNETTTPVEAGLTWVIAKKYRSDHPEKARFPGADIILAQVSNGPQKILKGFRPEGKIPLRDGTSIYDGEGKITGIITSGAYGQTFAGPVAMGFVQNIPATQENYSVEIRNQRHRIISMDLPFVKHRYYRKPR